MSQVQVKQSRADDDIDVELELEEVISHPPPQSTLSAAGVGVSDTDTNLDDFDAEPEADTGRRFRLKKEFIIGAAALLIVGVTFGVGNSVGNKRATSTFEKSFMKANAKSPKSTTSNTKSSKSPSSSGDDPNLLCGCQECEDVANEVACGVINSYCHTCQARIDWLQSSDAGSSFMIDEKDACKLVGKYEFPKVCGPCYKCKTEDVAPVGTPQFWCNNPACTDVLFTASSGNLGSYSSCMNYSEHLVFNEAYSEKESCNKLADDFPNDCPCEWNPSN